MRDCRSTKPCFHCKKIGNHHTSLCPKQYSTTTELNTTSIASELTNDKQRESTTETNTPKIQPIENSLFVSGESVILQTAITNIYSTTNNRTTKARLLFDTGSHRSYISSELVKKLQLQTRGDTTLSIFTFGSSPPKQIKSSTTEVKFKLNDGTYF